MESLAASISQMGLLQPIGIDSYYHLIFGGRRLRACRDILQWETIPCAVIDLESLLEGEYAENHFRKQLTISESTALGEAIERQRAKPRGRAKKETASDRTQLDRNKRTAVAEAADRAGFASATNFKKAKNVIRKGTPDLIAAMDSGEISIDAADAIAKQPKDRQATILTMPKDERQEVINDIRKAKSRRQKQEAEDRDLRLFRGLNDAVEFIAHFQEAPRETWAGLSRVYADSFSANLAPAIACLVRIQKEHPNASKRPELVKAGS